MVRVQKAICILVTVIFLTIATVDAGRKGQGEQKKGVIASFFHGILNFFFGEKKDKAGNGNVKCDKGKKKSQKLFLESIPSYFSEIRDSRANPNPKKRRKNAHRRVRNKNRRLPSIPSTIWNQPSPKTLDKDIDSFALKGKNKQKQLDSIRKNIKRLEHECDQHEAFLAKRKRTKELEEFRAERERIAKDVENLGQASDHHLLLRALVDELRNPNQKKTVT